MRTTTDVDFMTADKAYGARYDNILAMAQDLPRQIGNMAADAQRVNWSHIGDLGRIEGLALELAAAIDAITEAHRGAR